MGISAIIDHCETFYKKVIASTEDPSTGIAPTGLFAISRFRANGADPSAYVALIWDFGGEGEKVIASTRGDIDLFFDTANPDVQFTGDGIKKMQVVIINDNPTQTPIIGGAWEGTKL